jgi:hypothetical protein
MFSFCLNWHNSCWCSKWYYEVFLSTSYIKLNPLIEFLKGLVGSSERLLGGDLCISTQVVTVFPCIECVQILMLKQESNQCCCNLECLCLHHNTGLCLWNQAITLHSKLCSQTRASGAREEDLNKVALRSLPHVYAHIHVTLHDQRFKIQSALRTASTIYINNFYICDGEWWSKKGKLLSQLMPFHFC